MTDEELQRLVEAHYEKINISDGIYVICLSLPVSGMEYKFIPRIAFIAQAIQDEKLWFIFGDKYGCGGPIQFEPG